MLCTKHLLYLNISHLWARQGPQTKAQLHISIYVWPPNQFLKIDFAHNIINYNWIYPPPGPTGPTDISFKTFTHAGNVLFTLCLLCCVVCKVYLQKTDLEPNNSGYMQFCFSVSGPCRA